MTRRFRIAGVAVELCADAAVMDAMAPCYAVYADGGEPDVIVEVEYCEGYAGRAAGAAAPGFDCAAGDGGIELWRRGMTGVIDLSGGVVRAAFRAGTLGAAETALRLALAVTLPRHGGLILHASSVSAGGVGWVFAGQSGAGKSTIAELLTSTERVKLADELTAVRVVGGRWRAFATPFHGDAAVVAHGVSAELGAIHFLEHGAAHQRAELPRAVAVRRLLPCALAYVAETATAERVLDVAAALAASVPFYQLAFRPRADVAEVLAVT